MYPVATSSELLSLDSVAYETRRGAAIQDKGDQMTKDKLAECRAREADTWERVKQLEQEEVPRLKQAVKERTEALRRLHKIAEHLSLELLIAPGDDDWNDQHMEELAGAIKQAEEVLQ